MRYDIDNERKVIHRYQMHDLYCSPTLIGTFFTAKEMKEPPESTTKRTAVTGIHCLNATTK